MAPGGERGPLSQAHGQVCLGCALPQDTPSSCRPLIPPHHPVTSGSWGCRGAQSPGPLCSPGPPHPAGAWQAAGRVSSQLKHRACSCPFLLASPQGPRTLSASGRGTKGKRIWHRPSHESPRPGPTPVSTRRPGRVACWPAGCRRSEGCHPFPARGWASAPRPGRCPFWSKVTWTEAEQL